MSVAEQLPASPLAVTVGEGARMLSISESAMWREIKAGHCPVVKFGRSTRIPYSWLAARVGEAACRTVKTEAPTGTSLSRGPTVVELGNLLARRHAKKQRP